MKQSPKKFIPIILLVAIPVIIAVLCLILLPNRDSNQEQGNNINESSVNWSSYAEKAIKLSDSLKITSPGIYRLSGAIENGQIEVSTSGEVKLILDGVSITNNSGPAILVSDADLVIVETADGSNNVLADGSTYSTSDEDICATLFSKDDLVLQGSGTLIVTGNYEDGIVSKDDLKVTSGTYEINAKDDGLRGRDSIYITGGTLSITSGGDAIKSNNDEETDKGYILIDDGALILSAGDDGIHAESSLTVNGGTITVKKSYEGLEGAKITVNGGDISVVASDDGLNAAGGNDGSSPNMSRYQSRGSASSNYAIVINGGNIYVNSAGDGIDSNGSLTVNGGTVVVDGPASGANGALDAEGAVTYNGGTIIAVGTNSMAVAPDNSSNKNSISIFFSENYPAGTKLTVKDNSGSVILEHSSAKSFQHASLSSESFSENSTYIIYINDAEYATVTLSGTTTQLSSGGMMPSGAPGRMMPNRR